MHQERTAKLRERRKKEGGGVAREAALGLPHAVGAMLRNPLYDNIVAPVQRTTRTTYS